MSPNSKEIANLVTFPGEIVNENLHFLYSVYSICSKFIKYKQSNGPKYRNQDNVG